MDHATPADRIRRLIQEATQQSTPEPTPSVTPSIILVVGNGNLISTHPGCPLVVNSGSSDPSNPGLSPGPVADALQALLQALARTAM